MKEIVKISLSIGALRFIQNNVLTKTRSMKAPKVVGSQIKLPEIKSSSSVCMEPRSSRLQTSSAKCLGWGASTYTSASWAMLRIFENLCRPRSVGTWVAHGLLHTLNSQIKGYWLNANGSEIPIRKREKLSPEMTNKRNLYGLQARVSWQLNLHGACRLCARLNDLKTDRWDWLKGIN